VARAGTDVLDDVVGCGFQLIVADGDPLAELSGEQRARSTPSTWRSSRSTAPRQGVRGADGRLTGWLAEPGACALVPSDFHVFGGASSPSELPELLGDLRAPLQMTPTLGTFRSLS
jgi:hypothetical protein